MKITMVHPRLDRRGGAENFVQWMTTGLQERGHTVEIVTRLMNDSLWNGAFKSTTVHLIDRFYDNVLPRRMRATAYARRVESHCNDSDVVVAHNFPATVWATAARRNSARRVWFCHEPMQRLHWQTTMPNIRDFASKPSQDWDQKVFHDFVAKLRKKQKKGEKVDRVIDRDATTKMDKILTNSQFMADCVESIYSVPASACILGIPDVPAIEPIKNEAFCLWVTSELPYKNAIGFIEAVRIAVHELGAKALNIRVVGLSAESTPALIDRIKTNGTLDNFVFEGRVPYQKLQQLLSSAQFLVYPTVDEPFGLVPLEAMAFGRAVLASNIGGPRETVENEVNGLTANPLVPREFAEPLAELWGDAEKCDRFGAAGKKLYEQKFRMSHFLDRFEALIDAI